MNMFEEGVRANLRSISSHHDVLRLRANAVFTAETGLDSLDGSIDDNVVRTSTLVLCEPHGVGV